jgi:uncharacterized protein (DUF58 family)
VLVVAAGLVIAALPVVVFPPLWPMWAIFWAGIVLAFGLDALATPRAGSVTISVELPPLLYIGETDAMAEVTVSARGTRALVTDVMLDLDELLDAQPAARGRAGRGAGSMKIALRPRRRGAAHVERAWVRFHGPLGLMTLVVRFAVEREVPVVPNTKPVRAVALKMFGDRNARIGLKVERFAGDGTEFESLKEWVSGDDTRRIDWRPSARHKKLVVRQFRAERNHQVIFAVDTGRLMSEPLEGIPKLDHALNAALVLSWVCLRTGDRVGFFTFDSAPGAQLDPVGGMRAFPSLNLLAGRVDYSETETNFTLGLTKLGESIRRRSLIVVLTDFVDTVSAELMVENLGRLAKRHLILFVALRDPELERAATAVPRSVLDVGRAVVGAGLARDREVVLRRLRRIGVHTIDAEPAGIGPRLINTYLDIKRREKV